MEKWPQYNQDDLKVFLEYLQSVAKQDEQIVRIKIENERSTDTEITIEPQGTGDYFPSGAIYEIVVLGKKNTAGFQIQIRDDGTIFVYHTSVGAIFHNGVATLAH